MAHYSHSGVRAKTFGLTSTRMNMSAGCVKVGMKLPIFVKA